MTKTISYFYDSSRKDVFLRRALNLLQGGTLMTKKTLLKPGEKAPGSGQYEIVGPRGRRTGKERTVTKNEPMPPTEKPNQKYILVDPTKNKSGR